MSLAKQWSETFLANRPIGLIKHADLTRLRDDWLKQLAPATVVRRMALVSHLYTVAKKDWRWTYLDNPVEEIRQPTVKNERSRRIFENMRIYGATTVECPTSELAWVLRETRSEMLPTLITLAVETAMRRSELSNIRRNDIDFEMGTIYIADSKNGMSRYVPLSPLARYTLITYLSKRNPANKLFDISAGAVSRSFNRAVKKARLRYEKLCAEKGQDCNPHYLHDLRFHDLRHEATSRLAEIYEMHELAKITGHKDTRMLLRYYHPDVVKLTQKLAQSRQGQEQFNAINQMLLQLM